MIPKTGKEARALGVPRYFTGIACKRGHLSERYADGGHCVECDNQRLRPEGQHKQATKRYYDANKEKCFAATKVWKEKSGMGYEYTKRSRAKNPSLMHFANAKRHAAKMNRTPAWLNAGHWLEIESVYKYCSALRVVGLDYEVDHIIPLQGKLVSGLHAPWNLQVLPASENASKGNRVWQ
jgi:hypothetical protein